mmetsp:Transcript_116948/g.251405  ORF Transcript_116948/g.251405 Transcript_116948/m.251405 type:complete len:96 (+) Transcript_116948:348-635(+)
MKTHRKGMNLENYKIMKENMSLIGQINKLRKDLKYIDNEHAENETADQDMRQNTLPNFDLSSAILQLDSEIDEGRYMIEDLQNKKQELESQLQFN